MTKLIVGKVMWVGRATVFTIGLAVTLALMLGVATTALAAVPGDPFKLGKINAVRIPRRDRERHHGPQRWRPPRAKRRHDPDNVLAPGPDIIGGILEEELKSR